MSFIKCGGGDKVATGSDSWSTSSQTTISLGFVPKKFYLYTTSNSLFVSIYDEDYSTTKARYISSSTSLEYSLGTGDKNNYIYAINNDGTVVFNKTASSGRTYVYVAIG